MFSGFSVLRLGFVWKEEVSDINIYYLYTIVHHYPGFP